MEPTESDIEAAKKEAGTRELHQTTLEHDGEEFSIVFAAPSRVEWLKFITDVTSTDDLVKKNYAHENFILNCAKWPSKEMIRAWFGRKFATITTASDEIAEVVGGGAKARTKKL